MDKKIIIITAPSGSGKTTLVKMLLEQCPSLAFSISACTRLPRKEEVDGKDYHFLSPEIFQKKIVANDFLEWQMVYPGKYYGTLKSEVERIWNRQQTPVLDIDVQGALRLKKQFQGDFLSLFIKTPTLDVLEQRLIKRGTESGNALQERLRKAEEELQFAHEFDHVIVNDDLDKAVKELTTYIAPFIEQ